MVAALCIVVLRSPLLLWHGRVIAEEGTIYLQQAWGAPWTATLLGIHQGYFSLLMNILSLLTANVVPLEWVAVILTTAALAVLLLTVYLAVCCEVFTDQRSRWFAAGVCVLTPSIEVWLTAEDAQFVLALATAIICLSLADRHRLVRSATLVFAALSGPVSCFFTPFFFYRAWRQRTSWAWLQAALMAACSTTQGLVLLHSIRTGSRAISSASKDAWFGPVIFVKIFAVEFFSRLGAFAAQRIVVPHTTTVVCIAFWLLTLLSIAVFVRLAAIGGRDGWLCLAMALVSLVLNYAGIAESRDILLIGGFRYFFTGFALFSLVLVIAYARAERRHALRDRRLALVLVSLALVNGSIDAVGYWGRLQRRDPDWQQQVAAWRKDPSHAIRVAPAFWEHTIHLSPRP